jgi:hypothetical protein
MKIRKSFVISLFVCSFAFGQSATAVGALSGSASDVTGGKLAGAQVRYQRVISAYVRGQNGQPAPAPGQTVVNGEVTADANGAFNLPNLPVGDYLLCATVPNAPYLDPCQWAQSMRVTVNANAVSSVSLALAKGVYLKVRVNDPAGLLPQTIDGPMGGGKLVVGVNFANGAYLGAQNIGVDSGGRDYRMVIPTGMPLKLWMYGRDVSLTDASGSAVAAPPRKSRSRLQRAWINFLHSELRRPLRRFLP